MARWTGTWLEGPGVTLREIRHPDAWLGKNLGLPKEGPSSVASFSVRVAAFVVDTLASGLVGALFISQLHHPSPATRQGIVFAVLFIEHVLGVALTGQTLGMRLMGVKVLKLRDVTKPPGFVPALLRTSLLLVTVGVIGLFSKDGRGFHDVFAGCIVVRD